MKYKNYMTTGEFAKTVGVTKNTLFHYDAIGLFSPEMVLENEYRLYSIYQIEIFDTIMLLKDLGMSLKDIKEFLNQRTPQLVREKFQELQEALDDNIRRLKNRREWIQNRLHILEELEECDDRKLQIREYPRRYYCQRPMNGAEEKEFILQTNHLIMEFEGKNPEMDYIIGYPMEKTLVMEGKDLDYKKAILITKHRPKGFPIRRLEKGRYLCGHHIGHWQTVDECYDRMRNYMTEHQLEPDSDFIEYYVSDILMNQKEEEYVTEIAVKIKE